MRGVERRIGQIDSHSHRIGRVFYEGLQIRCGDDSRALHRRIVRRVRIYLVGRYGGPVINCSLPGGSDYYENRAVDADAKIAEVASDCAAGL